MPADLYGPAGLLVGLVAAVSFLVKLHLEGDARDRAAAEKREAKLEAENTELRGYWQESQAIARGAQTVARRRQGPS